MISTTDPYQVAMQTGIDQITSEGTQRERVPVLIFDEPSQMSYQVARRIANLMEERQAVGKTAVLGLPTGSTPIGVYQHLVAMHKKGLDFSNVITFNLDEYFPMDPKSLQSYQRFMRENLFNHVNIPERNIHLLDGTLAHNQIEGHCLAYEHAIQKAGGIDLLILGIGRSGHIGFNEPGSGRNTRTRPIVLDEITRKDAASDFFGEENVPREAVTMGVGTILDAREIILMATGEHKGPIAKRAVEGLPSQEVTASYLQLHRDVSFYLDRAAAGELTREKTPWLVKPVTWDQKMSKRAVIWLSQKLSKAILRLEAVDFHRNHLHDLANQHGTVDTLCRGVFEDLRQRVIYSDHLIKKKKVIVFSPHPDDDVISMGGMLDKLVGNENEVIVAYMTNGSVAVFDADVRRHLMFMEMAAPIFNLGPKTIKGVHDKIQHIRTFLDEKSAGEVDLDEVQQIKAYIRYAEAIAGIEVMGLSSKDARFLDMPFYKTGMVRKDPVGPADIKIVLDLLEKVRPDAVFVAGDLSDPHGTHRMCYVAIDEALKTYNAKHGEPAGGSGKKEGQAAPWQPPMIWLYRGAWQEWEIDRADVFLPLSKANLDRKIEAIFKHESQKDHAMFPGAYDAREFWERARDRNTSTADVLNKLGLPEFYAAEAFVKTFEM